jgi:hypothetical protein
MLCGRPKISLQSLALTRSQAKEPVSTGNSNSRPIVIEHNTAIFSSDEESHQASGECRPLRDTSIDRRKQHSSQPLGYQQGQEVGVV